MARRIRLIECPHCGAWTPARTQRDGLLSCPNHECFLVFRRENARTVLVDELVNKPYSPPIDNSRGGS